MKIDSTVFISTTATSTILTVPAGKVFKGQFCAWTATAGTLTGLIRASAVGTIYAAKVTTTQDLIVPMELGAGTYFWTAPISGAGSTLSILGALYVNTQ